MQEGIKKEGKAEESLHGCVVFFLMLPNFLYALLMVWAIYDGCTDDLYPIPSTEQGWSYQSVEHYLAWPIMYLLVYGGIIWAWRYFHLPLWVTGVLLFGAFLVPVSPLPRILPPIMPELNGTVCIYRDKTTFHNALKREYKRRHPEKINQKGGNP